MYHQEMNKMKHENLILLIIALIIIIAPLVAYNGLGEDQGYFGGADDAGSDAVSETGYKPWFESFWSGNLHLVRLKVCSLQFKLLSVL